MAISQDDLVAKALERVVTQYQDSPNVKGMIQAVGEEATVLQDALFEIFSLWTLDNATGQQLDTIGHIVGLDRPFVQEGTFEYFGYAGAPDAFSYGTTVAAEIGGRYASVQSVVDGATPMEDDDYRLHIRTKILANITSCFPDEIVAMIRAVLPLGVGVRIFITEHGFAEVSVLITRNLSSIERNLLTKTDLIPFPITVTVNWMECPSVLPWGFVNSGGIGTLGFINGTLASLVT